MKEAIASFDAAGDALANDGASAAEGAEADRRRSQRARDRRSRSSPIVARSYRSVPGGIRKGRGGFRAGAREFNSAGALFLDKALDGFHVADHDRPLAEIDQAPASVDDPRHAKLSELPVNWFTLCLRFTHVYSAQRTATRDGECTPMMIADEETRP